MDMIVIADSGLPIPSSVKRIDIALKQGVPTFIEVLETVMVEMQVEKAMIASEIQEKNISVHTRLVQAMPGVEITMMSHEELKKLTRDAKAIIRTGECTPYANVILQAGVIF